MVKVVMKAQTNIYDEKTKVLRANLGGCFEVEPEMSQYLHKTGQAFPAPPQEAEDYRAAKEAAAEQGKPGGKRK